MDAILVERSCAAPIQTRHGYYQHILDDLGCKVFRQRGLPRAQTEYLFNIYAQSEPATSGLTCEALACGTVAVGSTSRPCIWMKHISGTTVYDYMVRCGHEHNPLFTIAEAEAWTQESVPFRPIIARMETIITALKSIGISCADHEENTTNFMIDNYGIVKAIDYSIEDEYTPKIVMKRIYEKYQQHLNVTVPVSYLRKLESVGLYL